MHHSCSSTLIQLYQITEVADMEVQNLWTKSVINANHMLLKFTGIRIVRLSMNITEILDLTHYS